MSVEDFQQYWVATHAVNFAAKISQIKKYVVNTTVPMAGHDYHWFGCAEIWIAAEEQVESLQSDAFLKGARLDEPNWAAFWQTLVVDTDSETIVPGPAETADEAGIKIITVSKRKDGTTLADFRAALRESAELAKNIPGLVRFKQGLTREGAYELTEAAMDAVTVMWFDTMEAAEQSLNSAAAAAYTDRIHDLIDSKRHHVMAFQPHWIIGPEARE